MAKGILGRKLGMTQIWSEDGQLVPVSVVEAGPCTITQVKTAEKEGYSAIQIGFGSKKAKNTPKAIQNHVKKAVQNADSFPRVFCEVRDVSGEATLGQPIRCDIFEVGEKVFVRGTSKGKGFQGGVKRHGFHGGRKTHGSKFHRSTGSVGAGTYPGRVIKGKKLPGHMGAKTAVAKNLTIVKVDPDENLLYIKGAIPGPNQGIVYIYSKG
ncbi:MAG: 50S ribosomal protein L3 [Candidatus Hydrogenedentota bacterium]|nr:MAG: 50S ribosomal protein L3 [Candidatus Hydrogenedentota bacterium]